MTVTDAPAGRTPTSPGLRIVPARYWGQRFGAALLMAIVLGFAALVASSRNVQWNAIGTYLFDPTILDGVRLTLVFTVLAMAISILAGIVLAMMRLASNPILSGFAGFYIWFFRGTPLLVQIIFWFNIQLFIPAIEVGPLHVETNTLISAFTAALLALSLNESAYVAEIVRGGLLAVDKGQGEAATALGYTPFQTLTRIVLPQALRVIVPPMTSQYLNLTKNSSLAVAIGYQDIVSIANTTLNQTGQAIEGIAIIMLVYLSISLSISLFMNWYNAKIALVER